MPETTISAFQCSRCGHVWVPKTKRRPTICPSCKSPYWDKPRLKQPRAVGGIAPPPQAERKTFSILSSSPPPLPQAEAKVEPKPEDKPAAKLKPSEKEHIVTFKCQQCHEQVTAEFSWAGGKAHGAEPDLWVAECPKCKAIKIISRPKWPIPQNPEVEQKD